MTLHDVSSQLYTLSLDGFFNRERFTKKQLHDALAAHMREAQFNTIPNMFVMEIALPDGWWFFTVNKYSAGASAGYDYWIPETREQERALLDRFESAISAK